MVCGIGQFNADGMGIDIAEPSPAACPRVPRPHRLIHQRNCIARLRNQPMRRHFMCRVTQARMGLGTTGHRGVMQNDQAGSRPATPFIEIGRDRHATLLGNRTERAWIPTAGKTIAIGV